MTPNFGPLTHATPLLILSPGTLAPRSGGPSVVIWASRSVVHCRRMPLASRAVRRGLVFAATLRGLRAAAAGEGRCHSEEPRGPDVHRGGGKRLEEGPHRAFSVSTSLPRQEIKRLGAAPSGGGRGEAC